MGTKTTTDTSNQYNSGSMNTYNAFQPQLMGNLLQMANNPLGSSFFKNQLSQQQAASNQIGQRSNSNLLQNMRAGGGLLSNSAGFMAGALGRNQLTNNMMQANTFNSSLNSALQNRNMAQMAMQAYQPLQTGQNSTQSTGGLGTWLPQLAGAALGVAMPGIGSALGGLGFSAGYKPGGGGGSAPMATNPFGMGGVSGGMSGGGFNPNYSGNPGNIAY
jgi:hypothetical protein